MDGCNTTIFSLLSSCIILEKLRLCYELLTTPNASSTVPAMKEPIFLPRQSMPESSIARKDSSTSFRVLIAIRLATLFPIPNSRLSKLARFLRKVPSTEKPGLQIHLSNKRSKGGQLILHNSLQSLFWNRLVGILFLCKELPERVVVEVIFREST